MSPPLVSVITCALNQDNWVRETIPRIRESLQDQPHEMLVVDDHSTDGCCHGLDKDTTILRTPTRHGVTASRRLAVRQAEGDVYLFTDPHCHYERDALKQLVQHAYVKDAICIAATKTLPKVSRVRNGGVLTVSDRGLKVSYSFKHPARWPALLGTIYAVKRSIYAQTGGWPELPGVWGGAEQAWSLASWFAGVPIWVMPGYSCNHQHYHPAEGTKFSYRVPMAHHAQNAHWIHASFFPETYEHYWKPILIERFKDKPQNVECLTRGWESKEPGTDRKTLDTHRKEIANRSIYTEEDFFEMVLGQRMPRRTKSIDEDFVNKQRKRSKPNKDYDKAHSRQDRAIRWFIRYVPGCIKGLNFLDMGTRSGYVLDHLKEYGVGEVEGVEIVPETATWAKEELGRNVVHADMRDMPYKDNQWHRVLCIHSLEHVPDPEVAIKELLRVLMPGGWFLIVVPIEHKLSHRYAHYSYFPNAQTLLDMVNKFNVMAVHHETLELVENANSYEVLLLGKKVADKSKVETRGSVPKTSQVKDYVEQQRERSKPEEDYRKWNWRIKRAVNWAVEAVPDLYHGKNVVDLGTRDGYALEVIKNLGATKLEGIELVPEVALWAKTKLNRDVIIGDIMKPPYEDNSWDVSTCIHALEHVANPVIAIQQIARITRQGGYVFINVPSERRLNAQAAHNFNFPNLRTLSTMVQSAGLDIIKEEEVFSLPEKNGVQPGRKEFLLIGRKP